MKKILFTYFLMALTIFVYAQKTTEDVVYLKNGSIIRGTIIEFLPDLSVKIETYGRNIWVFETNEVLKMVKEEVILETQGNKKNNNKYRMIIDGAILLGESNSSIDIPLSFNFVHSYIFKPWLYLGMGTGVEFFEQKVIPLFIDSKLFAKKDNSAPYLGFKFGYSSPFTTYNGWFSDAEGYGKGGILLEPGLGIMLHPGNLTSAIFSFSYRHQRLNYHKYAGWATGESDISVHYNRFVIRFGFSF